MTTYIALIYKEPGSDFGVSFPDFPGCVSGGSTLEEARAMGAEALTFHIEGMAEDGMTVPEPCSLDAIMADPENRDGVAVLIPVTGKAPKTVRINVTIAGPLLAEIDEYAEAQGFTRSGFLAKAARDAMQGG